MSGECEICKKIINDCTCNGDYAESWQAWHHIFENIKIDNTTQIINEDQNVR